MNGIDRAVRAYLEDRSLRIGTTLENRVTMRLNRWACLGEQQHRVGRYVLDFAWPKQLIAIEADGPHHWRPDVAVKDVARDAWLRSQGWLIFRVDDASETLDQQLLRIVQIIRFHA